MVRSNCSIPDFSVMVEGATRTCALKDHGDFSVFERFELDRSAVPVRGRLNVFIQCCDDTVFQFVSDRGASDRSIGPSG